MQSSAVTKVYSGLRSMEFAAQLKMKPGVWHPDYSTHVRQTRAQLVKRARYIKTGRWTPGAGFEAVVRGETLMIRWVG